MSRYKLILSYDGTHYSGWQVQPNAPSIQAKIQESLHILTKRFIPVTGSGRTDAGVHALGQVAHFDLHEPLDPLRLEYSLNGLLPHDIRVLSLAPASPTFHARYDAIGKEYHYHLWLERTIPPFVRLYRHQLYSPLSLSLLEEATSHFIGSHDFTSFTNVGGAAQTFVRTIKRISLISQEGGLRLEFEGDGFLYKMIRNMMGILLDIAQEKRPLDDIKKLLHAKDRRLAGMASPAKGLFLMKVFYPEEQTSTFS